METTATDHAFVREAVVVRIHGGTITVSGELNCHQLETTASLPILAEGDRVLVWQQPGCDYGVILGRIAFPRTEATEPGPTPVAEPREVIISASERLVLRCGEGEIVLRGDGKVIIRGTDLVAKAKRANRIKGGQVVIN